MDWFSDEPIQVTLTGPVIFQAGEADLYVQDRSAVGGLNELLPSAKGGRLNGALQA